MVTRGRLATIGALLLLAIALAFVLVVCWRFDGSTRAALSQMMTMSRLSVGMVEADVVGLLGQPTQRLGKKAPQGELPLQRAVEDHVLVYPTVGQGLAVWVYVDQKGVVTCVDWEPVGAKPRSGKVAGRG